MTKALTVATDISQFSVMWHKLISGCKQVEKRITNVYRRSNYRQQLQVMWEIQYSGTDNRINVGNCGLLRSEITYKINRFKQSHIDEVILLFGVSLITSRVTLEQEVPKTVRDGEKHPGKEIIRFREREREREKHPAKVMIGLRHTHKHPANRMILLAERERQRRVQRKSR